MRARRPGFLCFIHKYTYYTRLNIIALWLKSSFLAVKACDKMKKRGVAEYKQQNPGLHI